MDPGTTQHALLRALLEGPATAKELGEAVGVDPSAARRHLESFLDRQWVEANFRQEGMGRPKKYYAILDEGREQLPRRYADLLALLAEAAEGAPGGGLGALMDRVAERLAAAHGGRVPSDAPLPERVAAAAEVLRELGFPTEVEAENGAVAIVRRDCAFLRLARAHQGAVCGHLDTGLLARLLGERVDLQRCIPWGDAACRHVVAPPADEG